MLLFTAVVRVKQGVTGWRGCARPKPMATVWKYDTKFDTCEIVQLPMER